MIAVVEKVVGIVMRKKPEINAVQVEIDALYPQIYDQAAKIAEYQDTCCMYLAVLPEFRDETNQQVVAMELDVAEQVFFTLYNRLRVLYGFVPLEGKKFTGQYNYAAHVR